MTQRAPALAVTCLVALMTTSSCKPTTPATPTTPTTPTMPTTTPTTTNDADVPAQKVDVKPVYGAPKAPNPAAAALCATVQGLAEERRGTCCSLPSSSDALVKSCTDVLSSALELGDVKLDEAKAKACAEGRAKQLDGCGWVGPFVPLLAGACTETLSGNLDSGARCRSSVECKDGLRCLGASPLDAGRCAAATEGGGRCGFSVDALSIVVGQPAIDARHPECADGGFCMLTRCQKPKKAGDACRSDRECGPGNHCGDAGTCVKGRIAIGGACVADRTDCVDGAFCVDGKCHALLKAGEPCKRDFDCAQGGCGKDSGAATMTCGMRCRTYQDFQAPQKTTPAPTAPAPTTPAPTTPTTK